MNGKELSAALRNGQYVYGTMIVSPSPRWPGVVAGLSLDFVFIDTEHVPLNRSELSWMCTAYAARGLAPVVRIPSPDPYEACMVLDGGAQGVIAPYVETPEQVRALRGAVKYRPLKGKRLSAFLAGDGTLEPELESYLTERNANSVLIVNIESRPAMQALDDILSVPQLDAVLIGPHDLSCSLGIPEQYGHPTFEQAVEEIIRKARERNVGAGIHVTWPEGLEPEIRWAKLGANLIVHSVDSIAFGKCMRAEVKAIKDALG